MIEVTSARPRRRTRAGALFVVGLVLAGFAVVPAPATAAAQDATWTVVPSSPSGPKGRKQFDYELAPKEEITDWFSVSNLSDRPLTVDLYPTDAFTAVDGGFALLPRSEAPDGVGAWISVPRRASTIPPGKRLDMPFSLKVPANAAPGDHVGGIIASVTEEQVNEEGQRVNVERRVAARVYLRVAGPLSPVTQITSVEVVYDQPVVPLPGGRMEVTYRVANLGNVRLSGNARVEVAGPLGVRLGTSDLIEIPELLPDSEIRLRQEFPSVFPAGRLTATVSVNPRTSKEALPPVSAGGSVTAVPWLLLGLLALVVALLAYRWWSRRRNRAAGSLPVGPLAQPVPAGRG